MNGFSYLLKKDLKMMLSGKFFLLAFLSLVLYSAYINLVYVRLEQGRYPVYVCDPNSRAAANLAYISKAESRRELEKACADRTSVGIDFTAEKSEIYMLSSGSEKTDHYREIWGKAVLTGIENTKTKTVGLYDKEEKSRREITAEFLFFELSAVGFLGLASILFKEKQMGVIRVHGILPVRKSVFILSKLCVFLFSDLLFTALLTGINVGVSASFKILPAALLQAGILSLIMALIGLICAALLPDFKQFSLFYLVLAVFITTPVFLAGQTGISWKWLRYHPMHHLFTAMKSAYFGASAASVLYYVVCLGAIVLLFCGAVGALRREAAREG